ncbi:LysE family translocator [Halomonas caseinilytica]|uniref:Threonine/homoserine/homoserine lactone efflux protein n=1 Tax=Halomonas caseinilytica TaxID=438744 RepID=A0A1M6ZQ48_9GAMM|nr:LysE family transporter [Halomonas caseinilytica]SEN25129.1 Threonine/homoserine/homoserine lactone efflux protein [Halomonas caseinilytica]SHL32592.1 Threonine/homoserine/homoserine lactone efflux protein [Halomonas caseinilytica]
MLEILAYAIGVMYTPGPVNLFALNSGLNGRFASSLGFFAGVGTAMLLLLLLFGWVGARWVRGDALLVISALGCLYIAYLALKVMRAEVSIDGTTQGTRLRFRDGLAMQLMNPKGLVATLPIATLQFPHAGIEGPGLLLASLGLAVLASGAPGSYALAGFLAGRRLGNPRVFKTLNLVMAVLLIGVAGSIGYEHVYLPLQV